MSDGRNAILYVVSGILLGMIGGALLGKMRLEPYLSDWVKQLQQTSTSNAQTWEGERTPFLQRLPTIGLGYCERCVTVYSYRYRHRRIYARLRTGRVL